MTLLAGALLPLAACSGSSHPDPSTCMTSSTPPPTTASGADQGVLHSVSLGLETVATGDTDWSALSKDLDRASINAVELSAGRVEFTAFPWDAHPSAAAEGKSDHLSNAMGHLCEQGTGSRRLVDISIDALVPNWIKADPKLAGKSATGRASTYFPSASALAGTVGDRYVAYAAAIAERYHPDAISFTELQFDSETFGADDLALYQKMTGATDWPRDPDGSINEGSASIAAWRTQLLTDLLTRVRTAIDKVPQPGGRKIILAVDTPVTWPAKTGAAVNPCPDCKQLLRVADRVRLWAYFGLQGRKPVAVEQLTAGLAKAGLPMRRLTIEIGLWEGAGRTPAQSQHVITPAQLAQGVRYAQTHGITSVNVTPVSRMTDKHWTALEQVWGK